MDVDESVSLSKPKAPAKPGQEPEDVSLTHKTPADIKPTVRKITFKHINNIKNIIIPTQMLIVINTI